MTNQPLQYHSHDAADSTFPLCLLAHNLRIGRNIGSLFRVADALGLETLYLTGSTFAPDNPKVKKASRTTTKYVPYEVTDNPLYIITRLRQQGYGMIALELTTQSKDIKQFDLKQFGFDKACLILGSENTGVSENLLTVVDATVHIPMQGANSSMNVAMACAIASYEITRQMAMSFQERT